MELRLDGKVALVTGASRGIGYEIASQFAEAGARVMICSRKAETLEQAAGSIDGEVAWNVANAADEEAARETIEATVERFGGLDILVNNAATNPYYGSLLGITTTQMTKTAEVNLQAVVTWTRLAWEAAMKISGGTVINITSIGAFAVEENIGFYNSTKAGVEHLTKQLAVELAPDVRVLGIAPGVVRTAMAEALMDGREEEILARIPRGRFGESADIAAVALFLAGPASSWMTGTTVTVDGGGHLRGF